MAAERVRCRIRWTRVFFVLAALLVFITVALGAIFYTYIQVFHTFKSSRTAAVTLSDEPITQRVNILLMGVDEPERQAADAAQARRSDTMIVVSINPTDGTIHLLSIPRDTKVVIPGRKSYDKITHAFAYGGPPLAVQTVEKFLQIPINYYLVADWQGFIQVVDILGGVDLYVEQNMRYSDSYADLQIDLKRGFQHLDGQKAGQYVRYRHDELGDIGRVQRQQRFLKALAQELLQMDTIFKTPALSSAISQYVQTDMSLFTIAKLANSLTSFDESGLQFEMLPGSFATIDGLSYWVPDQVLTKQMVERLFVSYDRAADSGNIDGPAPQREGVTSLLPK
ncbi:LCP family protein [Acetonema longum]|uniref:Cell envelope-related transcriptional attenuator n=1 Tax=Acetonema longum DSM 6540 TaxID=1009370 RepID=F7NHR9_9FIRM|nr:LCP family protein [Acetonema longum]EGO64444.1 cell envelope-related transcriptional attenuator [Acetonema longum DSM 6540]